VCLTAEQTCVGVYFLSFSLLTAVTFPPKGVVVGSSVQCEHSNLVKIETYLNLIFRYTDIHFDNPIGLVLHLRLLHSYCYVRADYTGLETCQRYTDKIRKD
jgi:hypothetical protein